MDVINGTSSGSTSVGRYSLRSEQNKLFSGNDDNHTEHHDNGSDSNDPPLSEYELLRLRKIKRNEARLAQLGLLVPSTTTTTGTNSNLQHPNGGGGGGGGETSALTTLFLSSPHQPTNNKTNKKKRKQTHHQDDTTTTTSKQKLVPRRILPKRTCTTTSSSRRSRIINNDDGYTSESESSIAASPILPKRILTLQPHQVAAAAAAAVDSAQCPPRREKRGRPRREDYVYKCDEVCGHCGGEWKLDGEDEDEEDTRLIRCKDCRGAFHLDCMMLHGKSEAGGDDIMNDEVLCSYKENNKALQIDKQDQAKADDAGANFFVTPKRCFQCECSKNKRSKRKKGFAAAPALLEAIVKKKMVTVRISPELPLEAVVVGGTSVTCYVTLKNS